MSFGLEVAARTLAQEVRGEPIAGQEAVAHVIKNRLESKRWGETLASVCLWPWQFSGWARAKDPNFKYACGLPDDDPTLSHMRSVMQAALDSDKDPTEGATHYVNLAIVTPDWVKGATQTVKIGHHTFYKGVP